MTKILFTKKEQEQLKCNPNVKAVSEKAITYTDEFKRHFIAGNDYHENYSKRPVWMLN